jgi:hypothetical protein
MEIGIPTWNSNAMSYSFRILKSNIQLVNVLYYDGQHIELPVDAKLTESIVREFLEKTKKYFTNPLTPEKVLRHLRQTRESSELPTWDSGWYEVNWKPSTFIVKSGEFQLTWDLAEKKETGPVIPADFTTSTTPRAQSPVPEQAPEEVRSIQIHDSLIPVGDLPLSDLPPLSFGTEQADPAKEEIKRRIREARLKLQLAKLKARRMEQKYFERYGTPAEDSEDSSEFSSDSEEEVEDVSFQRHSHA